VGTCEIGASVEITSLPSNQVTNQNCSENGAVSFPLTQAGNGTYLYTLLQRDVAGNASPNLSFEWTVDNSIPPSPSITNPTVNPVYTQNGSLTLQLSCAVLSPTVGVVRLSGDLIGSNVVSPAGALTTNCNSGSAQFVLQKPTEGSYSILIDLYNPNTDTTSAPISLLWVVDSTAPAAPVLISPSSDPYVSPGDLVLQGTCETGTTLKLEGAATHTETCQGGNFDWTISHLVDGEYDFTITQTDLALNVSAPTTLHWTRSQDSVAPPVILSPSTNPHTSNQTTLTISGSCTVGATVNLSGPQTESATCSPAGQFTFSLSPSADGTLLYSLTQTRFNIVSSATAFQWTRDTLAPSVQITSQPSAVNLSNIATFAFTSNEPGSTFECQLDATGYVPCTSPSSPTPLANGMRSYSIRAKDSAGNVGLAQSVSWEQKSFNTMALYRFTTSGALTTDSGPYQNHLTNNNLVTFLSSGPFPGAAYYVFSATRSLSVAQNPSLNLGTSALTIEGFFNVTNLNSKDQYYTLVSKASSTSSLSYEIRLRRGNNNNQYFIDVLTQLQGSSTINTLQTNNLGAIASTWIYFAVTYSQGTVTIRTGTTPGQQTIIRGTANYQPTTARLNTTNAPLVIGSGLTTTNQRPFSGMVDEIRISQTLRNVSIVPSQAFDPSL
jgi:hypothetical protein